MKVAVVVQRYGAEINGGAELHARYVAEHLARHVEVEVLTTCARDYITWANDYPPGVSQIGGVTVRRFPVSRPRDPRDFGDRSERVFTARHSMSDELAWLEAEGPAAPALVQHVAGHAAAFDYFLFFSFRYYHAYHGARAVPHKAILVPTAERDDVLGLGIFPPVLRGVRALMYNSHEERALLQAMAGTTAVPGVVVGVGSDVPESRSAARFRQRTGIEGRTAIYVGRIDENKGCAELFDFWTRYAEITPGGLTLTLIGAPILKVPDHPRIRHLGFVSDEEKFDALAAAEFLIMPSYFESLSMVALEAWAVGKPVLANGRCDVLRGQAIRSNAGLYYESYAEFVEAVRVLEGGSGIAATLGRNGAAFFRTHYAWPVIERKYLDMFARLDAEGPRPDRAMEPIPGWWARRQRSLPPAREVLAGLPSGALRAESHGRPARQADPTERRPPPADRSPRRAEESRGDGRRPEGARGERRSPDGRRPEGPRAQARVATPPNRRPAGEAAAPPDPARRGGRGRRRRGRHDRGGERKGGQ